MKNKKKKNDSIFLKACRREKTARTPIWLMRQAGRYMKEYRILRQRFSFTELCKNPFLAAKVAIEAAQKLQVDAAILFSDILLILEPLGFQLTYLENEGPKISNPYHHKTQIPMKPVEDIMEEMNYVFEAVGHTKGQLKPEVALIGFSGGPFTLAAYAIEGGTSKSFSMTKRLMYNHPRDWAYLMKYLVLCLKAYLKNQIQAGADAVQIFETWVGCLAPIDFERYVFPYLKDLVTSVNKEAPVLLFGTQTGGVLDAFSATGADVIGVDWRIPLGEAWRSIGSKAIMGNMDPMVLLGGMDQIRFHMREIMHQVSGRPGHIFNLGHGIHPATPVKNVQRLVEMVHRYRS